MRKALAILCFVILASSCDGVPAGYATKQQIINAAVRCGVANFEPSPAGAAYAAYVGKTIPDHAAKEDCIYKDLRERQGLLVTR